jgi:tetratricopeptide (TPR) repeat protein/cold shock CspA family protein
LSDLAEAADEQRRRWGTDASEAAAWDARAIVDRLRKAGQIDEAVRFGEEAVGQWGGFAPLRSALAWAFYTRDIRSLSELSDLHARRRGKEALARIEELVSSGPYSTFSPWPRAALTFAAVLADGWPAAALTLLDRLDPTLLSVELSGDYPSLRSRWHLATTKALEALGRWDDLLASCDAALAAPGFRAGDLRWIFRRRAAALEATGDLSGAAAILRELRGRLREWYVDADLARVLGAMGETADAIDASRRALAAEGELAPRWRTVALLADLLAEVDPQLSGAHIQLGRVLRRDAGWRADSHLELVARSRGLPDDLATTIDISPLRDSWRPASGLVRSSGVVKTLLPGGGSGFITSDEGGDLYFGMPRGENAPVAGSHVTFRIVDSFDAKKGTASKRAVDVRTEL